MILDNNTLHRIIFIFVETKIFGSDLAFVWSYCFCIKKERYLGDSKGQQGLFNSKH